MLEDRGDALEVLLDDLGLVLLVTVRTDVHGHEVHAGRRRLRSRSGLASRGAVHGDETQFSCNLELDRKVATETVMMDPC